MGCFGDYGGEEKAEVSDQQKWDYINLGDFRTSNCVAVISYIWLWILVFVAIAVYGADTFTAVRLLGFNEWSSQVKPSIPFAVSKWIFAVCIILSWAILFFEWFRALRVMSRGSVADDYLDPLAVKLQSMRFGTGWRRFLVFAELTKSKKKVTWIALFVYFQRKGAIRLLAADGPRQVVNALTLYSVAKAKLVPDGSNAASHGRSTLSQLIFNLEILANANRTQTVILSTMSFTLVIWVVSMLLLFLAMILYLFFLWHHITNETLNGFCRRKVETRLERIVKAKTEKIWAKQQAKRSKEEAKMGKSDDNLPDQIRRQPTLPSLGESPPKDGELMRTDSTATLPPYTSKPGTPLNNGPPSLARQPTLPDFGSNGRPAPPSRSFTSSSAVSHVSYGSSASLIGSAEPMSYSDPSPNGPPAFAPGPLHRTGTSSTTRSYGPPFTTVSDEPPFPPPTRTNTTQSSNPRPSPLSATPTPQSPYVAYSPLSAPSRPGTAAPRRTSPTSPYDPRLQSPVQGQSYEMAPLNADPYYPQPSRTPAPRGTAFGPPVDGPRRDFSAPLPSSGTAVGRTPSPALGSVAGPRRSATAPVDGGPGRPLGRSLTGAGGQGWV